MILGDAFGTGDGALSGDPSMFQTVDASVYCQPPIFLESFWDTVHWLPYIIYKTTGNKKVFQWIKHSIIHLGGENVH